VSAPSTTPASPRSRPLSAARHHPAAIDRFTFTYLHRELRGRLRQTLLIALGLGLGVGLVITVIAASAGVSDAQRTVLHSLYGIGTDLTITKPATPAADGPGGGFQANALQPASSGLFPATTVASVSHLAHVASAAGGLHLSQLTLTGGLPQTIPVEGVDLAHPDLGPLGSDTLTAGRTLRPGDRDSKVAVVDSGYARSNRLSVGSTTTLGGTALRVVGIVSPSQGVGVTDIYLPLATAQAIARSPGGASLHGQVNVIYVAADGSTLIPAVQTEIAGLLPSATVTSSSDLARQVTGSLSSAATLADDLGRWVAATTLVAAFAVASLLTSAAVTRRVRELGTLKALGWSGKRIITQVMSESLATGVTGAAMGIALGFAGAILAAAIAPKLSATVRGSGGSAGTTTSAVPLTAHVSPAAVAAAIVLALGGALIAGSVGAWRATRLQPASALAEVRLARQFRRAGTPCRRRSRRKPA
jgi:putative ABC transport system permease protein